MVERSKKCVIYFETSVSVLPATTKTKEEEISGGGVRNKITIVKIER